MAGLNSIQATSSMFSIRVSSSLFIQNFVTSRFISGWGQTLSRFRIKDSLPKKKTGRAQCIYIYTHTAIWTLIFLYPFVDSFFQSMDRRNRRLQRIRRRFSDARAFVTVGWSAVEALTVALAAGDRGALGPIVVGDLKHFEGFDDLFHARPVLRLRGYAPDRDAHGPQSSVWWVLAFDPRIEYLEDSSFARQVRLCPVNQVVLSRGSVRVDGSFSRQYFEHNHSKTVHVALARQITFTKEKKRWNVRKESVTSTLKC